MKRLKQLMISLAFVGSIFMIATPSVSFAATATQDACAAVSGNTACKDAAGSLTLGKVVKVIVNTLSLIVGVVAVIMIIVGGFKYITSGGDSNSVTSAKNTLLYALVGLVIVALAQTIVQFVLSKVK